MSWLPGQILDRDTATTAMILADIAGKGDLRHGHRLWPVVERWAADLGLTGSDAITQAAQPSSDTDHRQEPRHQAARPGGRRVTSQAQHQDADPAASPAS